MMLRRIAQRFRQYSWFSAGVDLLVVVTGILLALQLGAWVEQRKDRQLERNYLQRLAEDLQIEGSQMQAAEEYARARIEAARFVARIASNPELAAAQPSRVLRAVESASWRSFPQINAFVYRELQNTGRLTLIESEPLRRSLAEHYANVQYDGRVGQDRSAEERYDAAVAGVLTLDELETVEKAQGDSTKWTTPPERAVAIAREMSRRPAALAELAGIVQHHTFNSRVIAQMRARGNAIIKQIQALQSAAGS